MGTQHHTRSGYRQGEGSGQDGHLQGRPARTAPKPALSVNQKAMVIGGGVAGMSAAKAIADLGLPGHLIERTDKLGQALNLYRTWRNEEIKSLWRI